VKLGNPEIKKFSFENRAVEKRKLLSTFLYVLKSGKHHQATTQDPRDRANPSHRHVFLTVL
jgi:hypothetical protein